MTTLYKELPLLVVLVVLLVMATFLAASEASMQRVSHVRVQALANGGDKRARRMLKLLERFSPVLDAILLGELLVQIGSATLAGVIAHVFFESLGATAASIGVTLVLFVYGEVIPKTIAVRNSTSVALALSRLIRICEFALRPIVILLVAFADLQLPGKAVRPSPTVTEDELRGMAKTAAKEGEITASDRELIERAFRFGDRTAQEIMVPRVDITSIEADTRADVALETAVGMSHSRLLVSDADADHILGVVRIHDLIGAAAESPPPKVSALATPLPTSVATQRIDDLLRTMRREGSKMAIVVDEFGGTAGVVGIEDVLEELVGEIEGYGESHFDSPRELESGRWRVDGLMPVSELSSFLHKPLPEGEWQTVAGLVIGLAGRLPSVGEEVVGAGFRFRVAELEDKRVVTVDIEPASESPD